MSVGTPIKWGAIALVAYFVFRWVSNEIAAASYQPADDGIVGNGWAPPLPGPGIVYGWSAPWTGRGRTRYGSGAPWRPGR